MFASLLRQARRDSEAEQPSPFSSFRNPRRPQANEHSDDEGDFDYRNGHYDEDPDEDRGSGESEPLLPIFSSEVLGKFLEFGFWFM